MIIYDEIDDTIRYTNGAEMPDDHDVWAELDRRGLVREPSARLPFRRARVADIEQVRRELHAAALDAPAETPAQRFERYRAALGQATDPDRRRLLRSAMAQANREDIAQARTSDVAPLTHNVRLDGGLGWRTVLAVTDDTVTVNGAAGPETYPRTRIVDSHRRRIPARQPATT